MIQEVKINEMMCKANSPDTIREVIKVDESFDIKVDRKQFVKELKEDYVSKHVKKFPFEHASYHQCIPNPKRTGEFITMQLMRR
jgi:hypothetical protein